MLGTKEEIAFPNKKKDKIFDKKILELSNIKTYTGVKNVNLTINKGEIVGLLGLVGSGRTEILRSIFGIDQVQSGSIKYENEITNFKKVEDAINKGIVMIPEDRRKLGLVFTQNTKSNISITNLKNVSNNQVIDTQKEIKLVKDLINLLDIKPTSTNGNIAFYSGGNQQKVLLQNGFLTHQN